MATTSFANPLSGVAPAGQAIVQKPDGSATAHTTLALAVAAATAGDTIFVGPGTYDETDLAKHQVNWQFADGAIIQYTGSSTKYIFDDNSGSCSFTIGGHGVIDHRGMSGGGCFKIGAGEITVRARTIHSQGAGAILSYTGSGNVFIEASTVSSAGFGSGIFAAGGRVHVKSDNMDLGGLGYAARTTWGETYLDAGRFNGTLECTGGLQHLVAKEMNSGNSTGNATCTGGTQIIEFEQGGAQYGGATQRFVCNGGAQDIHFIDVEIGDSNAAGFNCISGTQRIFGHRYKNTAHDAFNVDAGTQLIDVSQTEVTQAAKFAINGTGGTQAATGYFKNSGTNGVAGQAGGQALTIRGHATFVSHSGATDSLTAGAAQNVAVQGFVCGNKALNANVTITVAPAANAVFSSADVV